MAFELRKTSISKCWQMVDSTTVRHRWWLGLARVNGFNLSTPRHPSESSDSSAWGISPDLNNSDAGGWPRATLNFDNVEGMWGKNASHDGRSRGFHRGLDPKELRPHRVGYGKKLLGPLPAEKVEYGLRSSVAECWRKLIH